MKFEYEYIADKTKIENSISSAERKWTGMRWVDMRLLAAYTIDDNGKKSMCANISLQINEEDGGVFEYFMYASYSTFDKFEKIYGSAKTAKEVAEDVYKIYIPKVKQQIEDSMKKLEARQANKGIAADKFSIKIPFKEIMDEDGLAADSDGVITIGKTNSGKDIQMDFIVGDINAMDEAEYNVYIDMEEIGGGYVTTKNGKLPKRILTNEINDILTDYFLDHLNESKQSVYSKFI